MPFTITVNQGCWKVNVTPRKEAQYCSLSAGWLSVSRCNTAGIRYLPQLCLKVLGDSWHHNMSLQFHPSQLRTLIKLWSGRTHPATVGTAVALAQCPPSWSLNHWGRKRSTRTCWQWCWYLVQSSCASQTPLLCPCALIPNSDPPQSSVPKPHPAPALVPAVALSAAAQSRNRLPQRLNGGACLGGRSSRLSAAVWSTGGAEADPWGSHCSP